jgi:hypothetical protein
LKNDHRPTRKVISDVTTYPHGLRKWVNQMLQTVAKAISSYFKDFFELKTPLDNLTLPPDAVISTADATSM